MERRHCASCTYFDLGDNDGGFMSRGFCNIVFPPLQRQPQPTEPYLEPNESCSLHSRAILFDIATREAWWPKDVSKHIEPAS